MVVILKRANLIFLIINIIICIALISILLYLYFNKLLPQKQLNMTYLNDLNKSDETLENLNKEKEEVKLKYDEYVENNKNKYGEYEKWEEKNKEIKNQL